MLNFFEILPIKLTFSTAVFEARRTFNLTIPQKGAVSNANLRQPFFITCVIKKAAVYKKQERSIL